MAEQPQSETFEPQAPKSPMPFADLSKTMAELYPGKLMEQLVTTFGEYKLSGINLDTLLQSNRKNLEALGAANKRLLEHTETVTRRQGEILRKTLEEASSALKALSNTDTPQDVAAKQGELLRQIILRTLDTMRNLADMTAKSSSEAFGTVNDRVRENAEEMKAMLQRLEK